MSDWNLWNDPQYSDPNYTPPGWSTAAPADSFQPAPAGWGVDPNLGTWNDPRLNDPNYTPPGWTPGVPSPGGSVPVPPASPPTVPSTPSSPKTPSTPPSTPSGPKTPGNRGDLTAGQQSIWDTVRATFAQYGLDTPDVLAWAKDQIVNNASASSIFLDLYDPSTVPGKVVNQLYPELALRRSDPHLQAWSIDTAQQYRSTLHQIAAQSSLTSGFLTNDDIVKLAVGDVAPTEVKDRIGLAAQYAGLAPPETRSEFDRLYGTGLGDHAAYWLDPSRTETLLQQQLAGAQLSGSGVRSGFGGLSAGEAARYATLGLTDQQAQAGFGRLVQDRQLFSTLPGEAGSGIGRSTELAAGLGGDALAQQQIEQQRRARLAVFGGGGNLNATQAGIAGLGSASSG